MSTEETMLLPQQMTYTGSTGLRLVAEAWGTPDAPPVAENTSERPPAVQVPKQALSLPFNPSVRAWP